MPTKTLAAAAILLLLTGCSAAAPTPAPHEGSSCSVSANQVSCEGSWAALDSIEDPESIESITMIAAGDQQASLDHFTRLSALLVSNTPLDIAKIPETVTDLSIMEATQLTPDTDHTFERFAISGDQSIIPAIASQPADNIQARLLGNTFDLNPLHQVNADQLSVTVQNPSKPHLTLEGFDEQLLQASEKFTMFDVFQNATSSSLTHSLPPAM